LQLFLPILLSSGWGKRKNRGMISSCKGYGVKESGSLICDVL
jgi:hypothetical protein